MVLLKCLPIESTCGDVILQRKMLTSLQHQISTDKPLIYCIKTKLKMPIYAGVSTWEDNIADNDEGIIQMPFWMLKYLHIDTFDDLDVNLIDLPFADGITIESLHGTIEKMDDELRVSVLQQFFEGFTALQVGMTLNVNDIDEINILGLSSNGEKIPAGIIRGRELALHMEEHQKYKMP